MADDDTLMRGAVLGAHRGVDGIQQLADGDGRRAGGVGALVVAAVGDDQALGGRQQRVEQQLAVLAARVAVAQLGVLEHQVVTIARGLAREGAVVETEQADHPVGHRAHRLQRADGEVAGAEVGPSGAALQAAGQKRPHLRGGELRALALTGLGDELIQHALELGALPAVAAAGGGERVGRLGDRGGPPAQRLARAQRAHRLAGARHQLGEAAREVDRAAVDVVEREHVGEQPLAVLGHGHAQQQRVRARSSTCRCRSAPACKGRDGQHQGPSGSRPARSSPGGG